MSLVNYGFFIGATPTNLDELLATEADDDICGIKTFMGSSTGTLLVNDAADLARIFGKGRRLIAVHAEDEARLVERKKTFAATTDVAMHSRPHAAVREVDGPCHSLATRSRTTRLTS